MFYESLGLLLEEASEVLNRTVRGHVADERVRTQLDAVAALLADVGAMWPRLFAGLEQETAILEAAVSGGPRGDAGADPLERHRVAVRALNERIEQAHRAGGFDERAVLRQLRAAMLAGAEVQRAIVEEAASKASRSPVRRI